MREELRQKEGGGGARRWAHDLITMWGPVGPDEANDPGNSVTTTINNNNYEEAHIPRPLTGASTGRGGCGAP